MAQNLQQLESTLEQWKQDWEIILTSTSFDEFFNSYGNGQEAIDALTSAAFQVGNLNTLGGNPDAVTDFRNAAPQGDAFDGGFLGSSNDISLEIDKAAFNQLRETHPDLTARFEEVQSSATGFTNEERTAIQNEFFPLLTEARTTLYDGLSQATGTDPAQYLTALQQYNAVKGLSQSGVINQDYLQSIVDQEIESTRQFMTGVGGGLLGTAFNLVAKATVNQIFAGFEIPGVLSNFTPKISDNAPDIPGELSDLDAFDFDGIINSDTKSPDDAFNEIVGLIPELVDTGVFDNLDVDPDPGPFDPNLLPPLAPEAGGSVTNPDGTITTTNPDGSTTTKPPMGKRLKSSMPTVTRLIV